MHWWSTKFLPQVQIQIFKQENRPRSPLFWSYSVHKRVVVNVYLIHVNYNSLVNRHLYKTDTLLVHKKLRVVRVGRCLSLLPFTPLRWTLIAGPNGFCLKGS